MLRALTKDTLIYSIPVFVSRGMAIFLLPLYVRIVSQSELGAMDLFLAFGNIAAFTVAFEISQGVARFIPEISNIKKRKIYSATGFIFTLFTYLIFIFICYLFSSDLSYIITGSNYFDFEFKLALVYIFLNGLFYYNQNLLRFEGRSFPFAIASCSYVIFKLTFTIYFGSYLGWGLSAIFISFILSTLIALIITTFFLKDFLITSFQLKPLKRLLSFSLPLVPASAMVFICLYVDRIIVSKLIGLEAAGEYGVGLRLASAFGLIIMGFKMALTPLIYKHYKEDSTPDALAKIFRYFVCTALVFVTTYSLMAREILFVLTTENYFGLTYIVPILTLSFCFMHINVFMPGITIKKKTTIILFINLGIASLNVAANFLLIPYFGLIGAAIATFASSFIGFVIYAHVSQFYYYVKHEWQKLVMNFLFSCSLIFCYFLFFDSFNLLISIILRLTSICLLIGFIIWSNLIKPDEIKYMKWYFSKRFKTG